MNYKFLVRAILNYLLLIISITSAWLSFIILLLLWGMWEFNNCGIKEEYEFNDIDINEVTQGELIIN